MDNSIGYWNSSENHWPNCNIVVTYVCRVAYNTNETLSNDTLQLFGLTIQLIKSALNIAVNHSRCTQFKPDRINFKTFDVVGKRISTNDDDLGNYVDVLLQLERFTLYNKNTENAICMSQNNSQMGQKVYLQTAMRKWQQLHAMLIYKSRFSVRTRFFSLPGKRLGTQYRTLVYTSSQIESDQTDGTWYTFIEKEREVDRSAMANRTLCKNEAWNHL